MARVLVVSNMYPPHHQGGYELSCRDVVDRWRARGHEVSVLTSTMRVPGVTGPDPAHVHRELEIFLRDAELWNPPIPTRRRVEAANEAALRRHLAQPPDLVSVWHMGAMSVGLLGVLHDSAVPTVFVVCDDWPTYAHKIDPWMRLWWQRPRRARVAHRLTSLQTVYPDLDRAGTFCFVSDTTRRRCREMSPWSFPESTVTFSGIDTTDFPPVDAGARSEWQGRLMTAGRLDPRKGFETAIRAVAMMPGTTLEILSASDDPYRAQLERLSADLSLDGRVRFGLVDRPDLRDKYRAADAFIFPSEWEEPFGLVPVEAMACGTPVVATGCGGSGEFLVDGANCLRVEPGDPASVAAAVDRLAQDPALRRHLVTGGLRTARDLTVDRLADVLEEWHLARLDPHGGHKPDDRKLAVS